MENMRNAHRILIGKPKGRHLDLGVGKRVVVEQILNKQDVRVVALIDLAQVKVHSWVDMDKIINLVVG
jgi:hypothetical protein